jgi:hypothetical protein
MRIAVMIVSLALFLILLLQSCAVGVGGSLSSSDTLQQGAAIGALLAFVYVLGGAFVMGLPLISGALFTIGALIAIPAGYQSGYSDLKVWGWLSAVLALFSFFGYHERKHKKGRTI